MKANLCDFCLASSGKIVVTSGQYLRYRNSGLRLDACEDHIKTCRNYEMRAALEVSSQASLALTKIQMGKMKEVG